MRCQVWRHLSIRPGRWRARHGRSVEPVGTWRCGRGRHASRRDRCSAGSPGQRRGRRCCGCVMPDRSGTGLWCHRGAVVSQKCNLGQGVRRRHGRPGPTDRFGPGCCWRWRCCVRFGGCGCGQCGRRAGDRFQVTGGWLRPCRCGVRRIARCQRGGTLRLRCRLRRGGCGCRRGDRRGPVGRCRGLHAVGRACGVQAGKLGQKPLACGGVKALSPGAFGSGVAHLPLPRPSPDRRASDCCCAIGRTAAPLGATATGRRSLFQYSA